MDEEYKNSECENDVSGSTVDSPTAGLTPFNDKKEYNRIPYPISDRLGCRP
jgi:hypothetical protein